MISEKKFLVQMDREEARDFLLKKSSYFSHNLPSYFNLQYLLKKYLDILGEKILDDLEKEEKKVLLKDEMYSNYPEINYILQFNKTKESYRPLTLIHSLLYVDLVNLLTNEEKWVKIKNRYEELKKEVGDNILCSSMPFYIKEDQEIKYPLNFWKEVEQKSIELSLKYNNLLHVDISNFYSSIYTHTLPWAFHGEDCAKEHKRDKQFIGNQIDKRYQYMNYGETVGIPQGNVISDFMAEMLLKYLDSLLVKRLQSIDKDLNYKIIRYRDDYRIFTLTKDSENLIKKELILLLQRHKLSLGESKTKSSSDIIMNSLKEDKLYWIEHDPVIKTGIDKIYTLPKNYFREETFDKIFHNRLYKASIQKHLFIIKILSDRYPNSGQLIKAFSDFEYRIRELEFDDFKNSGTDIVVLISIIIDVIRNNPKTTEVGIKLLSVLFNKIKFDYSFDEFAYLYNAEGKVRYDYEVRFDLIRNIIRKISMKSYNSYLEIWLQRLIIKNLNSESEFVKEYLENSNETLVKVCNDIINFKKTKFVIFNEDWLNDDYKINWENFINNDEIEKLNDIISSEEIQYSEYL